MPPRDGDPEGTDGVRPVRRRATGRWLVPLVVAGAAIVVLSTAIEGAPRITPIFGSGDGGQPLAPPTPVEPTITPPPQGQGPPRVDVNSTVGTIILVLLALVALAIAVLLIRFLVSKIRGRRRRLGLRGAETLDAAPTVADAPTVLRGIAAALVAFEDDREPGDAVVRAWLGLQQAAEDAGLPRSPAETPTEFTGRVLTRTGADRAALRTLLGLYLRARFGDVVITSADATDAQRALRALETSWERVDA